MSSQLKRRDQSHMIGLSKLPSITLIWRTSRPWGVFVDLENPLGSRLMEEGTVVQVGVSPAQSSGPAPWVVEQFDLERVGGLP